MPTPNEILAGLSQIANGSFDFAVGWHVVIGVLLVALVAGWRPPGRPFAVALSVPLASVSTLAWLHGNVFNGAVFLGLAVILAALAMTAPRAPIAVAAGWRSAIGILAVAYAWVYPHFLQGRPFGTYLYASPMGLVPCPTLALVIGLALVTGLEVRRSWTIVLASAGGFYALFGALRLGVTLDLGLLVTSLALLATALPARSARRSGRGRASLAA